MIDFDDEYMDLPDDPEEGFATLQIRKYRELEEKWRKGAEHWNFERDYVNVLVAYDEVNQLDYLVEWRSIPSVNDDFAPFFHAFSQRVEIIKQKILAERARRLKGNSTSIVVLDASSRAAIHQFIAAIRGKLDEMKLPDNKREALFSKLNAFAFEVDRNRTRTESIYAFAIETSRVAREVNENINPLMESLDRVFDFIDKARRWKDSLLPWAERRKVEGPPKQLPKPDLDDDIPF